MVDMIRRFSYTRVRVEKFTRNRISNFSKTGHVLQQGSQETAILARPRIRSLQSSAMTFRRARFSVLITSLLCALITLAALPHSAEARYASIVMDSRTGEVLYSRNADDLLYPASLTKIMTLYMTFDALERGKLRLGQKLPVSARAAGQAPTKLGLRKGESISVQDAMFGLITKSANDAATVLAEAMAQSEMEFARMMTAKARSLGMNRTTFRNASGLPNRHQKSTARDMAILGAAMIQDFPQYYHFLSLQEFDYKGTAYKNHNNLLGKYNGADGIKTGYIRASGFNLVASAKRGNNRLIGVVFGGRTAKTRDTHMASLLDRGFERIEATYPSTVPTPFDKPLRIALGTPHDTDTEIEVAATTQVPLPVQRRIPHLPHQRCKYGRRFDHARFDTGRRQFRFRNGQGGKCPLGYPDWRLQSQDDSTGPDQQGRRAVKRHSGRAPYQYREGNLRWQAVLSGAGHRFR